MEENVEEGEEELDKEITMEEVEITLRKMRNKKAAGQSAIVIEFIKYLPRIWV